MAGKDVLSYFSQEVCEWHKYNFRVHPRKFMNAVREINNSYNPEVMGLYGVRNLLNYNKPALRCAYLHKYSIHAAAVRDFVAENRRIFRVMLNRRSSVNVCCLGGGPGADIIGLSAAFCNLPEYARKDFEFTTIDYMSGWKYTWADVLRAAGNERYRRLGEFLRSRVSHFFITDNLCNQSYCHKEETVQAIRCADVLSMIKFVSALDENDAYEVLLDIYFLMKPGALVLFLDNSGGRTYEIAKTAAEESGLREIGVFYRNQDYENLDFDNVMCGEKSRSNIKISVKMWQKPY